MKKWDMREKLLNKIEQINVSWDEIKKDDFSDVADFLTHEEYRIYLDTLFEPLLEK